MPGKKLTIGFSPCPNDTFIFYGLINGKVDSRGIEFSARIEDVETLNEMALKGELDVTKVSYHALGYLQENYALLRSGGAIGRGCGPLVVARPKTGLSDIKTGPVAVPGRLTTAYLLLSIYDPAIRNIMVMTYDTIMQSVSGGEVKAGVIIHESRFTYPLYGLTKLIDLGEWWEGHTDLPIPLGGIIGKRVLGRDILLGIEASIRESIRYARLHPDEVMPYCRCYAQEMDVSIMKGHIDLYVNDFTMDLGTTGLAAVRRLLDDAWSRGIIPRPAGPLLVEDMV